MTMMVMAGFFHVARHLRPFGVSKSINAIGVSSLSFTLSLLILLYFLQGQVKQALST
jgi:hypothetical protein